jgi:hypothetical protein
VITYDTMEQAEVRYWLLRKDMSSFSTESPCCVFLSLPVLLGVVVLVRSQYIDT